MKFGLPTCVGVAWLAVMALSTSALAQNDGHLDGRFMSVDLKGKVGLVEFADDPPFTVDEKVKIETRKDACYIAFSWWGPDSYTYDIVPICQDASGEWDYLSVCDYDELADGSVVGSYGYIQLLADGDDHREGANAREWSTDGYHRFEPSFKGGELKSVKFFGNKGSSKILGFRSDQEVCCGTDGVEGMGDARVRFRLLDDADVPQGAKDAFADYLDID